jgi:RNase P subunit RPR2
MSKRLYPHRRVRYWQTYDVDDICALFSDLGIHPQTVRAWVKRGLKTTDKGKTPTLIYGNDLITYIKLQNSKSKCKTAFDEMFCVKCQDARNIFQRNVTVKQKAKFLQVSGTCRECKTTMFQNYKMNDLPKIKRIFHVVGVLELYDCADSTSKTHLSPYNITPVNESDIGTPYGDLFE